MKWTVPPKGISKGFNTRNQTVGTTWSSLIKEEQEVFSPHLFESLCIATSEAYALTQHPSGIESIRLPDYQSNVNTQNGPRQLTKEELAKYVPVFEKLVNLRKVSRDLHEGRLWRHSGKLRSSKLDHLITHEINKVV